MHSCTSPMDKKNTYCNSVHNNLKNVVGEKNQQRVNSVHNNLKNVVGEKHQQRVK
jgi:hypothetical protein